MTNPIEPNFTPGVGRLAADRFDFQKHVDGYSFRHKASQIDLFPTVVIGTPQTNVQDAIAALAAAISPPTIPDATASVKGVIRLNGDLTGTASTPVVAGLRGYPVSSVPPTNGYVLTWNGSTWTPAANTSTFTAAGDLGGTNTFQQVISLTGVSGIVLSNNNILAHSQTTSPLITQYNNTTTDGKDFTIRAQSSNVLNQDGGNLVLAGGKNGIGSGVRGSVRLQLTNTLAGTYPTSLTGITFSNLVEVAEVASGRRVLSLCNANNITTTEMPNNTGDMVIFIKNAVSAPVASPTTGFIMYSNNGNPYFYTSGGTKLGFTGLSGSASSGGGGSLPGTVVGYLQVDIGGVTRKIPYYAN
jgi:hypothetical protein